MAVRLMRLRETELGLIDGVLTDHISTLEGCLTAAQTEPVDEAAVSAYQHQAKRARALRARMQNELSAIRRERADSTQL